MGKAYNMYMYTHIHPEANIVCVRMILVCLFASRVHVCVYILRDVTVYPSKGYKGNHRDPSIKQVCP